MNKPCNPYDNIPDALYDDLVNASYIKATRSGSSGGDGSGCLTFATGPNGLVGFQDDKLDLAERKAHTLIFNREEMRAFVLGCKDGEFDHLI
jgi:hypothetical protein